MAAKITYDAFAQVDRIDGHQLHITNPDKSLTVVGILQHARRLYILEAAVPPDTPGAVHFQQSLIILDEDGKRIRYELDTDGNRLFRITNLDGICRRPGERHGPCRGIINTRAEKPSPVSPRFATALALVSSTHRSPCPSQQFPWWCPSTTRSRT